jgi:prepilin signal peptidase PulO-like enzyme (type II secretory pathway)
MVYLSIIFLFLFGAAIGSFVAVVANRHNTGLSFWRGRSFCFSCNTELTRSDLVPIFSFLFLKGKCRYCESKIPRETLVAELLMGALSVLAFLKAGLVNSLELGAWSLEGAVSYLLLVMVFAVILLISIYDLKHFIIPDSFLITLFLLTTLHVLISSFYSSVSLSSQLSALSLSALVLAFPFLLIFLISRGRWLGFGDVKYIAVIGFFLGIVEGLSAVILAFWIGAVFSVGVLMLKKIRSHINLPMLSNNLTIKSEIPFGPFLSAGILISFYFSLDLFQVRSLLDVF